jgi:hypothetical protein
MKLKLSWKRKVYIAISVVVLILFGSFFAPTPTAAQEDSRVVEYKGTDMKMPDLAGVTIGMNFDFNSSLAGETTKILRKDYGVNRFSKEGCRIERNVVCLKFDPATKGGSINGGGSSSFYGRNGGASTSSYGSGEEYFITLHMILYLYDGKGNYQEIPLASATAGGFAGTSNDSFSSSNRNGGGSSNMTARSSQDDAVGTAEYNAVKVLLTKNWFKKKFLIPNASVAYFGGAEEVKKAFAN